MTLKIAITAGGTSEPIDGVRKITNTATGSLGWHCLEAVFDFYEKQAQDFQIFYIHTENAVLKTLGASHSKKVVFKPVSDAASVYEAVDQLTKAEKIDCFIHSMAISDFTFSYAIDMYELAQELEGMCGNYESTDEHFYDRLQNPYTKFTEGEKIPSKSDLLIGLKRTKKVIPLIKKNNPKTLLVGFKLLKDVSEDELIAVANRLAEKNKCDLVLANELSSVSEQNHQALLIQNGAVISRLNGKREIAQEIITQLHRLRSSK